MRSKAKALIKVLRKMRIIVVARFNHAVQQIRVGARQEPRTDTSSPILGSPNDAFIRSGMAFMPAWASRNAGGSFHAFNGGK